VINLSWGKLVVKLHVGLIIIPPKRIAADILELAFIAAQSGEMRERA